MFRHTRVTHLLKNKKINEAQAKIYFGWTPSSYMLSEYSHLVSADVNETMLEINGIKTHEEKESRLKPKTCYSCKKLNSAEALFCQFCSKPLDFDTIERIDTINQNVTDKLSSLSIEDLQKVLEIAKRIK